MMRRSLLLFAVLGLVAAGILFLQSLTAMGKEPLPILEPVRIELTPEQTLFVSDYQAQAIHLLDASGQNTIESLPISGHPVAVAYDDKRIYVGNQTTHSIEIYNRQGKLLRTLGKQEGLVTLPNDIEVDPESGRLYVVDAAEKVVKVFDRHALIATFPPPDAEEDELLYNPTALTLDPAQQRLLVSDQGPSDNSFPFGNRDAKVQIYAFDGTYIETFSNDFSRPQGLTLNQDGLLYLADGVLGQVLVFDLSSNTLAKSFDNFDLPLDVAINPNSQDLYVTNSRAGTIVTLPKGGVSP